MQHFKNRLRKRNVTEYTKKESDDAYFLKKEWANYMNNQHIIQMEQIERALRSQEKALKELKRDNIDLYNKAIQVILIFDIKKQTLIIQLIYYSIFSLIVN